MKSILLIMMTFVTAMMSVSCVDEISDPSAYMQELTFSASYEYETRTALTEGNGVNWLPGDQIAVSGAGEPFTTDIDEPSNFTRFTGSAAQAPEYYAVYPYSLLKSWDGSVATIEIPQIQTAVKGTFADDLNISVASTSADDMSFRFHNVAGYVKFTITEESGSIKSVTVKRISGGSLSGEALVDCSSDTPQARVAVRTGQSVTLNSENALEPGNYYIAMLPGIYGSGLKFTFMNEDGLIATMQTAPGLILSAGQIKNVGEIKGMEFNSENIIEYLATEQLILTSESYFGGASVVTHVFDVSTGKGIITLNAPVTYLCAAFENCDCLTEITIPKSVKTIGSYSFNGCKNLAEIIIPEEVELIDRGAFLECKNLTKITLPSSLKEIGYSAFNGCERLANVVLPDSLTLIGSMAFCGCSNLNEITIPDSITMIDVCTFYDCKNLSKINLPNELISIGEGAFQLTRSLKEINLPASLKYMEDFIFNFSSVVSICFEGVIPPDICKDTFIGISPETKIYVPDSALNTYKNTADWDGYQDIIFSQNEIVEDYISSDYSKDGVVTILQTATIGNGIDIVLIGDGYSDRQIEDNTYMNKMNEAFNYLFTEEPYKSFKEYFNVYVVNAISKAEGYDKQYDSVFKLGFLYNNSVRICHHSTSLQIVKDYASNALTEDRLNNALIVVIMNSNNYDGVCAFEEPESANCTSGDGLGIAFISPGPDHAYWAPILHHEACGHGFAKLADEYAYEDYGVVPSDYVIEIQTQQNEWGWWKNVDFTSDPTATRWSCFVNDTRYANEGLGAYEGGLSYWSGVWRPTEDSIMRYNTGGFNAPSREAIWYRIHKLAYGNSWEYDYEDFVEYDAVNRATSASTPQRARSNYVEKAFEPTPPPVIVGKSWRKAM